MDLIHMITLFAFISGSALAQNADETTANQTQVSLTDSQESQAKTVKNTIEENHRRRERQLQIDRIEIPFSGTHAQKQIIKIPPNVSRIKLIRSLPSERPQRFIGLQHVRRYFPPAADYRIEQNIDESFQSLPEEYDYQAEDTFNGNSVKRNFNQIKPNEDEYEFAEDRNFGLIHYLAKEAMHSANKYKNPKKFIKNNGKYLNYGDEYLSGFEKTKKPAGFIHSDGDNQKNMEGYFLSYEPSETTYHLKEVPQTAAYGLKTTTKALESFNQPYPKQHIGKLYDPTNFPQYNAKPFPARVRQVGSYLNQQYTTHNPQVTTNFGLSTLNGITSYNHYVSKPHYVDSKYLGYESNVDKQSHQIAPTAASDHVVNAVPALAPGIQIIQPPHFGESNTNSIVTTTKLVTSSSQQNPSQRATIKDILDQDCPGHETIGFCESPPRYPMHQIDGMVKKCSSLMEAMSTDSYDDYQKVAKFASRADVDSNNNTIEANAETDRQTIQKRSANDGYSACQSEFTLIEPGYGKEVITGKWFVIVQHLDSIQRITTDTCKNPGKACGGLSGLKCSNPFTKYTKCVQRYSYHRLISWDPDVPEACPRMRIFKFPSSCVCHVGVA